MVFCVASLSAPHTMPEVGCVRLCVCVCVEVEIYAHIYYTWYCVSQLCTFHVCLFMSLFLLSSFSMSFSQCDFHTS